MAETLQNINKPKETLNEPLEKEKSDTKQSAVLEKAPEMENEVEDLGLKFLKKETCETEPLTKPLKGKENVQLATPMPPKETLRFKESVSSGLETIPEEQESVPLVKESDPLVKPQTKKVNVEINDNKNVSLIVEQSQKGQTFN